MTGTVLRPGKADKLARAARSAARVRAYQTDPDVVALRVERVRGWVDRLIWTGMVLGLLFTMANVQHFASAGSEPPWADPAPVDFGIEWVIAWLLDPMVSLVLIGVLMGEQIISRHQVKPLKGADWIRRTKWVALGCTYAMNTWSAWALLDARTILLHSVPPIIVVCAAEAITTLRHQITEAVHIAYRQAADTGLAAQMPEHDVVAAVEQPTAPLAAAALAGSQITDPTLMDILTPAADADSDPTLPTLTATPDPTPKPRTQRPTRPARPTSVPAKTDPTPEPGPTPLPASNELPADLVARGLQVAEAHRQATGKDVTAEKLRTQLRIKASRASRLRDLILAMTEADPTPQPAQRPDPTPETRPLRPDPTPETRPLRPDPTPETRPDPTRREETDPTHEPDPTQPLVHPLSLTADPTPDPTPAAGPDREPHPDLVRTFSTQPESGDGSIPAITVVDLPLASEAFDAEPAALRLAMAGGEG